jgi:3-dehydroquinate synthetase
MDKKFDQGRIRFVLLRQLGDAFVSKEVTEQDLIEAVAEIRA